MSKSRSMCVCVSRYVTGGLSGVVGVLPGHVLAQLQTPSPEPRTHWTPNAGRSASRIPMQLADERVTDSAPFQEFRIPNTSAYLGIPVLTAPVLHDRHSKGFARFT